MSEYEFWDELGNIFNAIVAYQHKTIEFNKRFVNPWLRLGTVFDQNDRNADALLAHKKAIEIDQENGSNWLALGDVYFKMGSFDDAAGAYAKAIELNPKLGWAYANLALTSATQQKYTQAVNNYVKSLELITDEKDRAMIWNRLGNVYRRVNDYENAFIAFQMADECDGQNTGFEDKMDDVTVEQRVMPIIAEVYVNNNTKPAVEVSPAVAEEPVQPADVFAAQETSVETVVEPVEQQTVEETVSETVETPVDEIPVALVTKVLVGESAPMEVEESAQPEVIAEPSEKTPASVAAEESAEPTVVANVGEETPVHVAEGSALQESEISAPEQSVEAVSAEQSNETTSISVEAEMVQGSSDDVNVEQPVAEEKVVEDVACTTNETASIRVEVERVQGSSDDVNVEQPVAEEKIVEDVACTVEVENPESTAVLEKVTAEPVAETASSEKATIQAAQAETVAEASEEQTVVAQVPEVVAEASVEESSGGQTQSAKEDTSAAESEKDDDSVDTTVAFVMSQTTETFANPLALNQPVVLVIEDIADLLRQPVPVEAAEAESQAVEIATQPEVQVEAGEESVEPVSEAAVQAEPESEKDEVAEIVAEIVALAGGEIEKQTATEETQFESTAEVVVEDVAVTSESATNEDHEPAYEESLKETAEPVLAAAEESVTDENDHVQASELKVEPDTKNAHVWNELGNVYFNTGAYEEAVTAYSKAIELDDWFAWPYSNLALVYVQKEKYAEAILLYQRSIELFASDKDKAITWNRLGNVYRRLNDYDNAIVCYQRADELDPNNATRSLRSRFSLLGSLNMEQSPSFAA